LKSGILAFAFGAPKTILANQLIAQIATQKAYELKAPIYTQLDIQIKDKNVKVDFIKEQVSKRPSTLKISEKAIQWAENKNITDLWIVAASPHLWRCARDVSYIVDKKNLKINIHLCKKINIYPESSWFCINSIQKRTQSKKNWKRRERIIRLIPFYIYKFITA